MKARIFIVDDHALLRRGLAALIGEEADMEVCGQAEDARSGLDGIMKIAPDVAIVDISLKGSSGLELIKGIKAFNPKIRILVLSVHHESIYALRALKAGAKAYVMKQDVANKVVEAIRRVHRGDVCVSGDIANQIVGRLVGGETAESTSPVAPLTDRELEIVNLVGNGLVTREIAASLHVSVKTVETHRTHIKEKLDLRNATQLVQFAVRWVEENKSGSEPAAGRQGEDKASFISLPPRAPDRLARGRHAVFGQKPANLPYSVKAS